MREEIAACRSEKGSVRMSSNIRQNAFWKRGFLKAFVALYIVQQLSATIGIFNGGFDTLEALLSVCLCLKQQQPEEILEELEIGIKVSKAEECRC